MYRVTRTIVKRNEYPEYCSYFSTLGVSVTNLYNAGLFRVRQNFTIHGKEHPSDLELQVQEEIKLTVAQKQYKNSEKLFVIHIPGKIDACNQQP